MEYRAPKGAEGAGRDRTAGRRRVAGTEGMTVTTDGWQQVRPHGLPTPSSLPAQPGSARAGGAARAATTVAGRPGPAPLARTLSGALLGLAALVILASPAWGQDVVATVLDEGYVVEAGADDVDEGDLRAALDDARDDGIDLAVAFLAAEPAGGAETLADDLIDERGGVALVVTPEEVGGASAQHADAEVDRALDAALGSLGPDDDPVDGVRAFTASLRQETGGADATESLPGPLGGIGLGTIIIGIIVLVVVLSLLGRILGGGRRRRRAYGGHGGYRRRRGGMGRGFMGGLLGGAVGGRMARRRGGTYGGTPTTSTRTRSTGGTTRSRSGSASRSRGSSSRSRGSSSRSRGSSSRRRR